MDTETNVILKYRRECDCWQCPDCDTENSNVTNVCSVCKSMRTATALIIHAWSEYDDMPPAEEFQQDNFSGYYNEDYAYNYDNVGEYQEGSKNGVLWGVIIAVIIFLIIVVAALLINISTQM